MLTPIRKPTLTRGRYAYFITVITTLTVTKTYYGTFVLFSPLEHASFKPSYLLMAIVNFNVRRLF